MLNIIKEVLQSKKIARVLIVEDNPKTQATLKDLLGTLDADLKIVDDGEAVFSTLKNFMPNVIVLDIHLPKMNGVQVMEKLQASSQTKEIPIVTFSSTWNESTNQAYKKDEQIVQEYLEKRKVNEKKVTEIIPKYQGQEGVDIIHPQVIVSVASALLNQNYDLSSTFQNLLYISQKQLKRIHSS